VIVAVMLFLGLAAGIPMGIVVDRVVRPPQARRREIGPDHVHVWGPWTVVQEVPIYLYDDPDAGKKIPDRMDAQLKRECVVCEFPQHQTVRGLDQQWRGIGS
jgi:hypothetical protein